MSFSSDRPISRRARPKIPRRSHRKPLKRCRDDKSGKRRRWRKAVAVAVAERLEALKRLIPSAGLGREEEMEKKGEATAADRILEHTADYILRLRTQVEILKHLVEFYGVGEPEL